MKKHKIIRIAIAFVMFILLFAVYLLLRSYNKESAEQVGNLSEKNIIDVNADEIKELSFSIAKEEKNFIKEEEQWKLKQDPDFPVDPEQMQVLTDALMDVNASREIEDAQDLGEFGLLEPVNKIKVTTTQKSDSITITIGATNTVTGDSYIYLNNESDRVYMVDGDLATVFGGGLMNYAKETPYPSFVGSDIMDIQMEHVEEGYQLKQSDNSSTGWYLVTQEEGWEEAQADAVSALHSTIAGLTYANYYDYKTDDPGKYGFDQPFAILTAKYKTTASVNEGEEPQTDDKELQSEIKIVIGKEDGNGNRYVQINNSKEVHGITSESINNLLDIQEAAAYENKSEDVEVIQTKDLSSLDITIKDKTNTFLIESSEDEEEAKYFLGEQEINGSQFSDFYAKITGLGNQGTLKEQKEIVGNPDISIIYHLKTGTVKEISFISYDNNFYVAVTPENEMQYLVNKMKVKELIDYAHQAFPENF